MVHITTTKHLKSFSLQELPKMCELLYESEQISSLNFIPPATKSQSIQMMSLDSVSPVASPSVHSFIPPPQ